LKPVKHTSEDLQKNQIDFPTRLRAQWHIWGPISHKLNQVEHLQEEREINI